ncbi:ring-cleaving dioxygenase [Kaistia terrae]|uniref:Ring-cleaving dioxygenase n=1 Tax=Kaistia terrae TaxID=537017 RepID=A0ABW0PVU0_9HYPH|nr:ring-cleaving dioxygenase [Kaistia terrae]MCX5576743.1 ring-cleaving dioxygenase [Kaistia terrae]
MSNGIHHVTAISGPARRNLTFYAGVLGLRLVKKTVNFDDPRTYHLYYGDEAGRPGTILTFFPWENAPAGQVGRGETFETAFRVPASAIGFWTQRLLEKGVAHETPTRRFGEPVLVFRDPDGVRLALIGVAGAEAELAQGAGDIPAEAAIRGFHSVTLLVDDARPTGAILGDVFGFADAGGEDATTRYRVEGAAEGGIVDLRVVSGFPRGNLGVGTVHHVAFRAADDAEQAVMVRKLIENHGLRPTSQKNRDYFRSVYFREPNGVLFEIATDVPGFAVDEPATSLGQQLKLPAFLEPRRAELEGILPELA